MAQSDARSTGNQEVAGSTPTGSGNSFVEIDHEIFSTVILSHWFKTGSFQFRAKECPQKPFNSSED